MRFSVSAIRERMTSKSILQCGICCILLFFAASVACGMWGANVLQDNELAKQAGETVWENQFKWLVFCAVFICCTVLLYAKATGSLTEGKLVALLFLMVFAARVCYILETGIATNQHDTSVFSNTENNYGHTGYIRYLLEEGHLPDSTPIGKSQFYHPPLHHILCAVWLAAQEFFSIPFETACENLQILTLFYSMVTLYAAYRIFKLLGLRDLSLYLPLCVLGFHPTFFLFSGSINNDCLSVMFAFLAVWQALEWHKKPSFPRIAVLGLCIGCAMFAKLATGIIAPAVAFLFLHKLATENAWRGRGRLILQFCLFGVICIPLGIGWQVRNYLLFETPLTYVPKLSVKADQYLGDYSVWERFFDWDSLWDYGVYPMRAGKLGAEYFEHCIPLAVLKMSLFGEYYAWKNVSFFDASSTMLFCVNVLLVHAALAGMVYCAVQFFRKKTEDGFAAKVGFGKIPCCFFLLYWLSMMISYVPFCFEYPHFCSMDFRYIVPTLLVGAVFIGVLVKVLEEKAATGTRAGKACAFCRAALIAACAVFAVCSVIIYPLYY